MMMVTVHVCIITQDQAAQLLSDLNGILVRAHAPAHLARKTSEETVRHPCAEIPTAALLASRVQRVLETAAASHAATVSVTL